MSAIIDKIATALHVDGLGKSVLITGATGFLGTETAIAFLKHNYKLHLTARSQEKADEWLAKVPGAKPSNCKFFIVGDMMAPGAFDEAIKGVSAVAHLASPFHYHFTNAETEMLQPAIQGTLSILKSAAREPSVNRVVITSSFTAILDLGKWPRVGYVYRDEDWNPATYEEAKESTNRAFVYCASKGLAEKAAWDFVKSEKPEFALTTLCPPVIFGPPEQPIRSMDALNTSMGDIYGMMSGKLKTIPPTEFPVGVDVRDVALAHVKAVSLASAKGQRYLLIAWHCDNEMIAAILHKKFTELKDRLVPCDENHVHSKPFESDSTKAQKELGLHWISFEKSIVDTAKKLLEIEAEMSSTPSK